MHFHSSRKSFLLSRLVKKPSKAARSRTPKHVRSEAVSTIKEVKKLVHFNQKPSAAARRVEKDAVCCAKNYPVKGELTLSALGTPSLDQIITD